MVEVVRRPSFERNIKHIRDKKLKEKIKKHIRKIIENPESAGEHLKYGRKFEKRIYMPPYRLLFAYDRSRDIIYLIDFDKRDKVYRRK